MKMNGSVAAKENRHVPLGNCNMYINDIKQKTFFQFYFNKIMTSQTTGPSILSSTAWSHAGINTKVTNGKNMRDKTRSSFLASNCRSRWRSYLAVGRANSYVRRSRARACTCTTSNCDTKRAHHRTHGVNQAQRPSIHGSSKHNRHHRSSKRHRERLAHSQDVHGSRRLVRERRRHKA